MAAITSGEGGAGARKFRLRDLVDDPRIIQMLALGFSSGLPILLVLSTFTLRLAASDIDVKAIGLFSYVALPYSLKFLWAPSIDRLDPPLLTRLLGRRRAWMVVTQVATALALVLMALSDPIGHLALLGLGAFLVAFCAATQDVVIDGWRIRNAGTDMQGIMAATSNLGYQIGRALAGFGALYIAAFHGWEAAYLCMAAAMPVGFVAALCARPNDPGLPVEEPKAPPSSRQDAVRRAVVEPLTELYGRMGHALWAILLLVALYRMPDFISGVMANPLYIKLGYDLPQIATIVKLAGIWIGVAGSFAGGWAISRFGMFPALVAGAFIAAASHLSLAWLALGGPLPQPVADAFLAATSHLPESAQFTLANLRLAITVAIEALCGSFAGIALITYMSSLTTPGYAATQYALFSSLYALPGKLVAGLSGFVVAAYGYPTFFTMTAAVGIPVVALCFAVGRVPQRKGPDETGAIEAEPEPKSGNPFRTRDLASGEGKHDIPPIPARAPT